MNICGLNCNWTIPQEVKLKFIPKKKKEKNSKY